MSCSGTRSSSPTGVGRLRTATELKPPISRRTGVGRLAARILLAIGAVVLVAATVVTAVLAVRMAHERDTARASLLTARHQAAAQAAAAATSDANAQRQVAIVDGLHSQVEWDKS